MFISENRRKATLPAVLAVLGALAMPAGAQENLGNVNSPSVNIVNDVPVVLNAIANRTADIPEPPAGMVALRLSTAYAPDVLPGGGVEFHQTDPEVDSLWAMESLEAGEDIPAGAQIENGVLFLKPGELQMVTVVYRNPTDKTVQFVALPHQDSPSYLAQFAKLTCFCLSFVYEAPADGSWYRVIRVGINPDTPVGSKIDAVFTILTDPNDFLPAGS
jgi:hypothetical protein